MPRRAKKQDPKILEIDGIPTTEQLVTMGLAHRGPDSKIQITREGHEHLGKLLRAKAAEATKEGTWHGVSGKHPRRPEQPGIHPQP